MSRRAEPVAGAVLVPGGRYKAYMGGSFDCLEVYSDRSAKLRSIMSGGTFVADGIEVYADGAISWNHVSDLHYTDLKGGRK